MRPDGINDLQIMWAIRDLPSDLIDSNQRLILLMLLAIIGNHESCYDSYPKLSKKIGLSESTIRRGLNKLEKLKMLIIKPQPQLGRGYTNEYSLNYQEIINCSEKVSHRHPSDRQKGVTENSLSEIRVSQRTGKGVTVTDNRYTKRNKKAERENLVVDTPKKPDQNLYTKKTFTFTREEQQEAIARDIHIQPCFNNFVLHLTNKGREEFERWEWETWFARERNGRTSKAKQPEDDGMCSRCMRPAKGCYCDRPDERPKITGAEKLNGHLKHVGSLL